LFQRASIIKIHLSMFVYTKWTCSCHDVAEKLLFGNKQQSLTHYYSITSHIHIYTLRHILIQNCNWLFIDLHIFFPE
jgi:hypothetical protein